MRATAAGISALLVFAVVPATTTPRAGTRVSSDVIAIRCGKILTMAGNPIDGGVILVKDGKIAEIGGEVVVPDGATIIDASERWAMPGLVDLHAHIGGPMRDINDMVHPINPELNTLPTIDPDNNLLRDAVAGGVTTILYIPGSGTNIGGFGTLMKTGGGRRIEDLVVRFPGAMKVAQAWNPERGAGDLGASRTGMWWMLRRRLDRAKAYNESWTDFEKGLTKVPPARQEDLEPMRGLFQKKYPVIIHTADARDVMGTVRMFHDEYGLEIIISHGEDKGYRVAPEIAKRNLHTDVGPRLYDPPFWASSDKFIGIPSYYYDCGVKRLSINTDSPVVPEADLIFQASMAVRFGLPEDVALRAVTIESARGVMISDRLGSLEAGKDADIVLWTGNPLDVRNHVVLTVINGKIVYDARSGNRRY